MVDIESISLRNCLPASCDTSIQTSDRDEAGVRLGQSENPHVSRLRASFSSVEPSMSLRISVVASSLNLLPVKTMTVRSLVVYLPKQWASTSETNE